MTHSPRKRDILHIISDTDRRGAQIFARDLERELEQLGISGRVLAISPGSVGGIDAEVAGGSRLSPMVFARAASLARHSRLVVAHGSTAVSLGAVLSGAGIAPLIIRQISETRFWLNSPARRHRVGLYLRTADAVVALAERAARDLNQYTGVPRDKITVIPNGVPRSGLRSYSVQERRSIRISMGMDPDATTLLFVGALVPEKNPGLTLRILRRATGCQLLVAGDGPLRRELENEASHGLAGRVLFMGSVDDMSAAYGASDLVAFPSYGGDSMPAALIEAGMCGIPAVAMDVGAIDEIVLHGSTGLVAPRGDEAGFERLLQVLAEDEPLRRQMSTNVAAHCVSNFEIGVVAAQWMALIHRVLSGNQR